MDKAFYDKLEGQFVVNYPLKNTATYSSNLNYSLENTTSYQRWFRYKEGFSTNMVENLIKRFNKDQDGIILDPFMGSGSTLLASNNLGLKAIGFEVNPFSYFLAQCKLENYTKDDINEFNEIYSKFITINFNNIDYTLPVLSFSNKVFNKDVEKLYMGIKSYIDHLECNIKVKNLLKLGWLSNLEASCNYRKAGNGLKLKKYKNSPKKSSQMILEKLLSIYEIIKEDLINTNYKKKSKLINDSCLNMKKYINSESISGIIFSPPYANCFDYTEIYKLELWFGDFIKDYKDLKDLRKKSLRSNLSANLKDSSNLITTATLKNLLDKLSSASLWDAKIPTMLKLYFSDMFNHILDCYNVLNHNGFCCIVVGNSAYGGIVFPTDLLIAEFAKSVGFNVESIDVGRYIIPSSQQYNETRALKQYLRESIVCLRKK